MCPHLCPWLWLWVFSGLARLASGDDLEEGYVFARLAARSTLGEVGVSLARDELSGVRGLFANGAFEAGDLLLAVPLARCLVETRALPASLRRRHRRRLRGAAPGWACQGAARTGAQRSAAAW